MRAAKIYTKSRRLKTVDVRTILENMCARYMYFQLFDGAKLHIFRRHMGGNFDGQPIVRSVRTVRAHSATFQNILRSRDESIVPLVRFLWALTVRVTVFRVPVKLSEPLLMSCSCHSTVFPGFMSC